MNVHPKGKSCSELGSSSCFQRPWCAALAVITEVYDEENTEAKEAKEEKEDQEDVLQAGAYTHSLLSST